MLIFLFCHENSTVKLLPKDLQKDRNSRDDDTGDPVFVMVSPWKVISLVSMLVFRVQSLVVWVLVSEASEGKTHTKD